MSRVFCVPSGGGEGTVTLCVPPGRGGLGYCCAQVVAIQGGGDVFEALEAYSILDCTVTVGTQSTFAPTPVPQAKQQDEAKVQERRKKNLEQELAGHREEAQTQRKHIYQLEKDREKYAAQASEATTKYYSALEEVKIRAMTITDLQKQISESEVCPSGARSSGVNNRACVSAQDCL